MSRSRRWPALCRSSRRAPQGRPIWSRTARPARSPPPRRSTNFRRRDLRLRRHPASARRPRRRRPRLCRNDGLGRDQRRRAQGLSPGDRAARAPGLSYSIDPRSMRCAASSRISVISCTNASSKPSCDTRWPSAFIRLRMARPIGGWLWSSRGGKASASRSNRASPRPYFSSRCALPSSVAANALRDPSAATSSIRPMSASIVSVG